MQLLKLCLLYKYMKMGRFQTTVRWICSKRLPSSQRLEFSFDERGGSREGGEGAGAEEELRSRRKRKEPEMKQDKQENGLVVPPIEKSIEAASPID